MLQDEKRLKYNSWMFVVTYIFMGIVSGALFDALVTFLQLASPETAKSFASFMGAATFLAAGMMFFAPKIGYKKIMAMANSINNSIITYKF